MGWNPAFWKINVISVSSQHITCLATLLQCNISFFISFVYGLNTEGERRILWGELVSFTDIINDSPWTSTGDFKELTLLLGLTDLRFSEHYLTWWDSNTEQTKYRKLDRVLINSEWHNLFPNSTATFLSRGLSDHCPAAINLGLEIIRRPKPFQFFAHFIENPDFLPIVAQAWSTTVKGSPWFILTQKLKAVKNALKGLNSRVGNLHSRVNQARNKLSLFQNSLPTNPSQLQITREQELMEEFSEALRLEECFLKQKSRVNWLKVGDGNNKYFFQFL